MAVWLALAGRVEARKEKRKKAALGSVRLYAGSRGRTLKHVFPRSVHMYILPGYHGSPTTGAALHGKGRTWPLMPVHIPWTRDALDTRKPRCDALIYLVVWGRASYLVASL